jgi:hypothetical protein
MKLKKQRIQNRTNILLIALTGFEFFFRNNFLIYFLIGPISFLVFKKRKKSFNKRLIIFLSLLFFLTIFQCLYFENPLSVAINVLVRFTIYVLIASLIKATIVKDYVRIMYVISIISLVFHSLINVSNSFYNLLISISSNIIPLGFDSSIASSNPNNTLIVFTVPHELIYRNSGPFWEPGMFGVFLVLALCLTLYNCGIKNRYSIVFIATIITTLSTTAIIALMFLLAVYFVNLSASFQKFLIIVLFPLITYQIISLPFIGDKVEKEMNETEKAYSRFGAFLFHYEQIQDKPLLGYGVNINDDQLERLGSVQVSPNGLSNVVRFYGIPFSIIIYILLFKSMNFLSYKALGTKKYAIVIFLSFLIVSFSQDITTRHFSYVLLLIPLATSYTNKRQHLLKSHE